MTQLEAFDNLVGIMDELRQNCPWDQKQTIHSLRQMTLEETYELAQAIEDESWAGIKEELGDLLLHILFYSKIGSEQNQFTLKDVIEGLSAKLINRHPHIYGDVKVKTEEDVKRNWEMLKLKEGKTSVLSGVPKVLPSIIKAMRLQEKAKLSGFEWEKRSQVWEKVKEEENELWEAIDKGDKKAVQEEFGDLIFSLINFSRFLDIDADMALEGTNMKFIARFTKMEALARAKGKELNTMTLTEMDDLWHEIKQQAD